jgi:HAD superfamily hydrolase (TIGR01509 family)
MTDAIRAVIFDFNGTLFNDTEFHNRAWIEFSERYGKILSPNELDKHIHGHINREILEFLFQRTLTATELKKFYEEKEEIYRKICHNHPEQCRLTKGAREFLECLVHKNIPRTIATAAYLPNVRMYFDMFQLERWFCPDTVIYDSGEYRGKPHPDMFLAAALILGIPVAECMIIEDSTGGVQAAKNAGAGKIVAVDFEKNPGKFAQFQYIDRIISNFRDLISYFS